MVRGRVGTPTLPVLVLLRTSHNQFSCLCSREQHGTFLAVSCTTCLCIEFHGFYHLSSQYAYTLCLVQHLASENASGSYYLA